MDWDISQINHSPDCPSHEFQLWQRFKDGKRQYRVKCCICRKASPILELAPSNWNGLEGTQKITIPQINGV
jgi:hypothetical protein